MTALAPIPSVVLAGQRIQVCYNEGLFIENPDGTIRKKNALDHIASYLSGSDGVYYFLQLLEKITIVVTEVFTKMKDSTREFFQNLGAKLAIAWAIMTIPRTVVTMRDMISSVSSLRHREPGENPGTISRRAIEAIRSVADTGEAILYTVGFLTCSAAWIRAGDVVDVVYNVADAQLSAQEQMMAKKTINSPEFPAADPRVKSAVISTQRYALLKLIKAVCSVVAGVLGLSLFAFGGPLIPAIALIVLSTVSIIFAMWSSFYKDANPYGIIDYFNTKEVKVLAPAA